MIDIDINNVIDIRQILPFIFINIISICIKYCIECNLIDCIHNIRSTICRVVHCTKQAEENRRT